MSDLPAEGGCACGAVRYRLTARPLFVHCCHCTWCQRETGSAFVINALIESDRLETLKGTPAKAPTPSESGKGQTVFRCPSCMVALWSIYGGLGQKMSFVRVGTLDDPTQAPPDIHIYTKSKQPWVVLPRDVPAHAGYYRWREEWPEEAQQRRMALKK